MSHSYYLSLELIEKIKEYAKQQQRSESAILRIILSEFFENKSLEKKNGENQS